MLVDVEGGSCMGRVVSVAGWEACVRPDWRTWSGTGKPPARSSVQDEALDLLAAQLPEGVRLDSGDDVLIGKGELAVRAGRRPSRPRADAR